LDLAKKRHGCDVGAGAAPAQELLGLFVDAPASAPEDQDEEEAMPAKLVRAGGRVCIQFPCEGCGKSFIVALADLGGTFTCRRCGRRSTTPAVACHYRPQCDGTYRRCNGAIEKLSPEELRKAEAEAWKDESFAGAAPTDAYRGDLGDIRGSLTTYRCARCGTTYPASYGVSHYLGSGTARCEVVRCESCGRTPSADELPEADTVLSRRPGASPYLWLDMLVVKVKQSYRAVKMTLVMVVALDETGRRQILANELSTRPNRAFWTKLLHGLADRGLTEVGLVVADASDGLEEAIAAVFSGAVWQRCRADFVRSVLADIPRTEKAELKASLATVFTQADRAAAGKRLRELAKDMEASRPAAAAMLLAGADEAVACMAFPKEHWARLFSTDAFRSLNGRVRRMAEVYGDIFPDEEYVLSAARSVSADVNDEWKAEGPYLDLAR
jgi:hypothetical protein